ncbi:MAG: hypothetical protein PPP58_07700 [Natronomonas sp.]
MSGIEADDTDAPETPPESDPVDDSSGFDGGRKEALFVIIPFFLLATANLVLILLWGLDPLWGFLLMPPILFICVINWIAIRGGFAENRTEDHDYNGGV